MPAAINEQTRKQLIHQWISGDTREKIAIDNGVGEGTVSGIVNEWKKGLDVSEYESVRELAVQSKKQGIDLNELALRFRLYNITKKSCANEDKIESFISNCISGISLESLSSEKIVDITNQLFNISKSESIPLEQVPDYIKQKLLAKQKLDEQIKEAEAVLQSKNVAIETIDEHFHLNQELCKHGLSIKHIGKLLNVIKNIEQEGYDAKKIMAKAMSIKSLKDSEKHLRNNCEMLAKRIDRYKQILPLAEKITAMKISMVELLVFDDAVSDTAEQYNLPIPAAAFQVINHIKDYNKLGGLKKQLAALCTQQYAVREVCSHQNQAMVTLLKLQSCGITEQHILNLHNSLFEGNRHNMNPDLQGHIEGAL
jgi:hypothetical protein